MEDCVSTLWTCTVMCHVIAALFLYRCLTKCYSTIFHSQGENTSAIDCNWGNLAAEERHNCRVETDRDGTRAETRFGLPAKRTSPFISAGVSVQSSTGFLGVRVGRERL